MKSVSQFHLTKEQKEDMKEILRQYFHDELDVELGNLKADILIDFLSEHIGKYYYNLSVVDAMAAIKEKTDDLILFDRLIFKLAQ